MTAKLSENPAYGFAVGRIRALEASLLDRTRYERLILAKSGEDFAAALVETAYARFLQESSSDVPKALEMASRDNTTFLSQYALDPWLLDLLRLPDAFRRLKADLKRSLAGNGTAVALPAELGGEPSAARVTVTVAEVTADFSRDHDPAAVDMAVDKTEHALLMEASSVNEFVTAYLRLHADVENLRTLVRMKLQPGDGGERDREAKLANAFLAGGTLDRKALAAALTEPWEVVFDRFAKGPPQGVGGELYRDYLEQGIAAVRDRRTFLRMERLGRELELRFLRRTRYATFGCEPLVAFFLFRENELRNLRQLYAAKLAGVSPETAQDLVAYAE